VAGQQGSRPRFVRTNFLKAGEGAGKPICPEHPYWPPARAFEVATDNQMTSGVSGRYASALFELAREQNELDKVDQDLGKFQAMLDGSSELSRLVKSPAFAAEEQERALGAVMDWAAIGATTGNFLKVVTRNRRLFAAEDMIKGFRQQLALHRGEMVAEVQSATPLNDAQLAALKSTLKASYGKDVRLNAKVDPLLLGGLVVKVGSRMFDSSLRTKLMNLKVVLKGTG
jgi:F-type H+-transporting ATPase subunit delta